MRVHSVNVGLPCEVVWRGEPIRTGIYKEPVAGRVPLRRTNLDGDRQADLRVRGGREKAVYAYPSEYYQLWSRERPELRVGPGAFGENLTTEGLIDDAVSIGDRFRIGTAELVVTQPPRVTRPIYSGPACGTGRAGVLWVALRCSPAVAAERERTRGDRVAGMAESQDLAVHRGVVYEFEVDTTRTTAVECARGIAERVRCAKLSLIIEDVRASGRCPVLEGDPARPVRRVSDQATAEGRRSRVSFPSRGHAGRPGSRTVGLPSRGLSALR